MPPRTPAQFTVSVLSGEEHPHEIPIGGTIWTNYAALQSARYMEVFLDGIPPHLGITLWQQVIIESPTERAVIPSPPQLRKRLGSWLRHLLTRGRQTES